MIELEYQRRDELRSAKMRTPTDLRQERYELGLSGYLEAPAPFAMHSIYIKLNI